MSDTSVTQSSRCCNEYCLRPLCKEKEWRVLSREEMLVAGRRWADMKGNKICDTCYKSLLEHAQPGSMPCPTSHTDELWARTRCGQPADDQLILQSLEEVDSGMEEDSSLPILSSSSSWAKAVAVFSHLQKSAAPARKSVTSGSSHDTLAAAKFSGAKASIAMLQQALDMTTGEDDTVVPEAGAKVVSRGHLCHSTHAQIFPTKFFEPLGYGTQNMSTHVLRQRNLIA
jgi:hypothetical protein